MLTLKEFMDCQNSFETETEYGEPQHWVYLKIWEEALKLT